MDGSASIAGRYRVLDRLGEGGMSVVWRAHDDVLDRVVAVKVLAPGQRVDAAARARVQSEARAAAALSHRNVAAVHDYGEVPGQSGEPVPYVVMELVNGPTLTEVLTDGPLDPAEAMRICADVAAGLAAAHARGLVHRDVKPGNVIVTADGAKLVDFGIAAAIGEPDEVGEDGIMYGTPAYLAPERLEGGVVVPGSDVYALGLLLYRLLAGKTPWSAQTTTQMLRAHAYLPPRPLPDIDGVPAEVADLCRRCLAKDPVERPTAAEAAACLTASGRTPPAPRPAVPVPGDRGSDDVSDSGSRPTADPAGAAGDRNDRPSTRRSRRRRAAIAMAIVVLVTSLSLLSLRHFSPSTDRPRPAAPEAGTGSAPGSETSASETGGRSGTAPNGPDGRPSGGDPRAADPPAGPTIGSGPRGNTTAPAAPGTSPAPQPARRGVNTTGGSAEVECVGTMAHLISWTPAAGYETQTVQEGPKQTVHVFFRSGNKHVKIQAKCSNGVPDITVR